MSRGSQIVLGVVFAVAAVFFGWFAWYGGSGTPGGALMIYCLSAFSGLVAAACLLRRGRAVTLRILGGIICLVTVITGIARVADGEKMVRPLLGIICFGIPCGYLAIAGKYPQWGQFGGVLGDKNEPKR